MSDNRPRIVFVTLSDDVGSERIVSEMGRQGASCAVLGQPGCLASLCQGVIAYRLPAYTGPWAAAVAVPRRLEALVADWCPDAVVPIDDLSAQLLRNLATAKRTSPVLRNLLHLSLGDPDHYRTVSSRSRLIELAATLGIRTPGQRSVANLPAAVMAAPQLGYPLLLKREQTCGGRGVALVEDGEALSKAFRAADRKAKAKHWARRLVGLATSVDPPLTLQAHVPGTLTLRTVACREGRVLAGMTFAAERLDPPLTGSSTVIRPIENVEIDNAVTLLVAALGCSGFVSFDFLASPTGPSYLIEMNARAVGSGHLGVRFGHDIYGRWLAQFQALSARASDPPPRRPCTADRSFSKRAAAGSLERVSVAECAFSRCSVGRAPRHCGLSRPLDPPASGSSGTDCSKARAGLRYRLYRAHDDGSVRDDEMENRRDLFRSETKIRSDTRLGRIDRAPSGNTAIRSRPDRRSLGPEHDTSPGGSGCSTSLGFRSP